jgi:hypothetical protein
MSKVVDKIISKLEEYGIEIYHHYSLDKNYYFLVEEMIICLEEEENLSISFKATTKPEVVANNILLLQEIKEVNKDFSIAESFIYNEKGEFLMGDKSHKEVEKSIGNEKVKEYVLNQQQLQYLLTAKKIGNC